MTEEQFKRAVSEGIPKKLPSRPLMDPAVSRAPRRMDLLTMELKKLALKNALRYFPKELHRELAPEFFEELQQYGRIFMHRFRPQYEMFARPLDHYPCHSTQAASIMLMIQNNLDPRVAQYPYELITYGGNGSVFQNWAQYLLTMRYLSEMTDRQTLAIYSGHPLGLFPSHSDAPRVVITNGMVIPNYSSRELYEQMSALGVTQYGQMTAGSYMYIGPQGIVHGTTITLLNAARIHSKNQSVGKVFVSSGLGGMSGAQAKASVMAGMVGVIAEINPAALKKRMDQGWVDEAYDHLPTLIDRIHRASRAGEAVSLAYQGNVVDLWEMLARENIQIDLGSDQTSLHNPFAGGYYPVGLSFEASNRMMTEEPDQFKERVQMSLRRQVAAINQVADRGMYFWDYGNAFLFFLFRGITDIHLMCRILWGLSTLIMALGLFDGFAPVVIRKI